MGLYSRYILPSIVSCCCGVELVAEHRRVLVPRAKGVVLELGAGSGHNFGFYDPAAVSQVYALEPEPGMVAKARRTAARAPVKVSVLPEPAETVSLPDASVDTVLVTFAMCTIPGVAEALRGARRVIKPGGRLLFCEHGRAPDADVLAKQQKWEPLWKRLFGGCHLTRDIPALVREAGFSIDDIEAAYMPKGPQFAGYMYRGSALAA